VEIPGDRDDQLRNLILQDSDELLAIRKISKYFPDSPPGEHIHVLVEPPENTATSSREQELLEQVTSFQALLNKSTHGTYKILGKVGRFRNIFSNRLHIVDFDVVVHPKRKANKWIANIEHVSLEVSKNIYVRCINHLHLKMMGRNSTC
jgi:hypothetical protein